MFKDNIIYSSNKISFKIMGRIITNKINFGTLQPNEYPKPGSFLYGFDTADDIFKKIDNVGNITIIGSSIIEDTYLNIASLIDSNSLEVGSHYKITNRADAGIILLAISTNKFSLEGKGTFLNPDFQNSVLPTSSYNAVGVWHLGLVGLVIGTSVCFWNGLQYLSVTGTVGSSPDVDVVNWSILSKSIAPTTYVSETDSILYDFNSDLIVERNDKRSNKVSDIDGPGTYIANFQWGNDDVLKNTVTKGSGYYCINNRGTIQSNTLVESAITTNNINEGDIYGNNFVGVAGTFNKNIGVGLYNSTLTKSTGSITILTSSNDSDRTLNSTYSDFEADLDMGNLSIYSGSDLIIPTNLNYVGKFNLVSSSGSISKIVNLPIHRVRFTTEQGLTQDFIHTSVSTAVATELISNIATTNTIIGGNSDFIEYEIATINDGGMLGARQVNRRYNTASAPKPKVYKAFLNQGGIDAPVETVLVNTLSATPVWSRFSGGRYRLTLNGEFTIGATFITMDKVRYSAPEITLYRIAKTLNYIEINVSSGNMDNIDLGDFMIAGSDDRIVDLEIMIEVY